MEGSTQIRGLFRLGMSALRPPGGKMLTFISFPHFVSHAASMFPCLPPWSLISVARDVVVFGFSALERPHI